MPGTHAAASVVSVVCSQGQNHTFSFVLGAGQSVPTREELVLWLGLLFGLVG